MALVRTSPTRKEQRAARTVARYVTDPAPVSPRENYEPRIDKAAYHRRATPAYSLAYLGGGIGGAAATIMGTTAACVALGLNPLGLTGEGLALVSAWSITPLAAIFGLGMVLGVKPRLLRRHVWASLRAWLRERYAIELAPNSANRVEILAKLLDTDNWEPGAHTVFEDVSGKEFRLHYSQEGCWVEEVPVATYTPNDYQPAGTPAASVAHGVDEELLAARLPREATVLHARGCELLATAAKRMLSVEGEHVVKRVGEDYRQLLRLSGELHLLGEVSKADTDALVQAMVALNAELEGVLAQERASLSGMLHAQLGYIRGRSLAGELGLTLPARSAGIEALAEDQQER